MKLIKSILFSFIGFISLYAFCCLLFSSSIIIKEKINIDSNPYYLYNTINNLNNWKSWNPYLKKEKSSKIDFNLQKNSTDSFINFKSEDFGETKIRITKSQIISQVEYVFKSNDFYLNGIFELRPDTNNIKLSCIVKTKLPFYVKGIKPIIKKRLKKDIIKALINLKEICEKNSSTSSNPIFVNWQNRHLVYLIDSCNFDNLEKKINDTYLKILNSKLNKKNIEKNFIQYYRFPKKIQEKDKVIFKAGFFLKDKINSPNNLEIDSLKNIRTIQLTHYGEHSEIHQTHRLILDYCKKNDLELKYPPYEIYSDDQNTNEILIIYELID